MGLPEPKPRGDLPRSLTQNARAEDARERADRLKLSRPGEKEPGFHLSLSPISGDAMDGFEDFYIALRRQDRTLKRYEVMDALMRALESEDVQAEVVKVLSRQ